jgi:hypothetical protein
MQSDLLDVVIGVVFAWFLLSVVLSAVQEAFALVTRARAKNLWLGIGRLFDPSSPLPRSLADVAFRLPVSGSLDLRPKTASDGQAPAQPGATRVWQPEHWAERPDRRLTDERQQIRRGNQLLYDALEPRLTELAEPGRLSKVTHIPATAFSGAMLDLAQRVFRSDLRVAAEDLGWAEERIAQLERRLPADLPGTTPLAVEEVVGLSGEGFASQEELRALYESATQLTTGRDVAAYLKGNPQLAKAVRRAAAGVASDERVRAVREVLETWFDREMTGLSTFYRRQNRKILLLLGIPLVLFAHANSIRLFNDLRQDASLREATLGAASSAVGQDLDSVCRAPATGRSTTSTTSPSGLGVATTAVVPIPTTTIVTSTTVDPLVAAGERLRCAGTVIDKATQFRVGLAVEELKQARAPQDRLQPNDVLPYLGKAIGNDWGFVGRPITLVALLFGAQFWFDVLRRLVGIRKTMKGDGAADHTAGQ